MLVTRADAVANPSHPPVFVVGNFVQACCWNVPRLPLPGETLVATGVHIEAGGKGLNVAVCLQRLGMTVSTLIGCGTDAAGADLLALLHREGIDTAHVHQLSGASGWGSGWIAADGQNAIAVFPGANLLLTDRHVAQASDSIAKSHLVYGQFETAMPAVTATFLAAHARGIKTVLNPSPWQAPPAALQQSTHTLIVNETEAQGLLALPLALTGAPDDCAQQVAHALSMFWRQWSSAQCLIVTLGAGGSLGFHRDDSLHCWHVAAPFINAIDSVGAGDAFASGYCAGQLAGQDLPTALRWGNACGAYLASQMGVLGALPNAALLSNLLAEDTSVRHLTLR
jgi:ribokinase